MAISWAVGYFGTPHILTKFMGITDVKEMSKAKYIGLAWQTSVLAAAGLVGLIGIAYFSVPLSNKELVFVELVKDLFTPLHIGFILSAVAGATLSVITAQVLVLVSVITEDFYHGTLRKNATDTELLWVYHASVLLISALSFMVSFNRTNSIQQLVHYAWMGFGCSFGPLMLLSLHSNYINKYGAIAAMLVGSIIAGLWHLLGKSIFLITYGIDIPAVVPGFILSIMAAYAISYLSKNSVRHNA
jgi:sodium/proline symporter